MLQILLFTRRWVTTLLTFVVTFAFLDDPTFGFSLIILAGLLDLLAQVLGHASQRIRLSSTKLALIVTTAYLPILFEWNWLSYAPTFAHSLALDGTLLVFVLSVTMNPAELNQRPEPWPPTVEVSGGMAAMWLLACLLGVVLHTSILSVIAGSTDANRYAGIASSLILVIAAIGVIRLPSSYLKTAATS